MDLSCASKAVGVPRDIKCVLGGDTKSYRSAENPRDQCSDMSPGHTLWTDFKFGV